MKPPPLDFHLSDRIGRVGAARMFSNIVSPPIMGAVLGIAVGLYERPSLNGFLWAALYGLMISLLPILFIVYMIRTGRVVELHMTNRRERYLPYLIGIGCALAVYLFVQFFSGPILIGCLALLNMVQFASLGLINFFWLVSFHTTAMTATLMISLLLFGIWTLVITVPLLILVAAVRLYLRRHSSAQVLGGVALGASTVFLMVALGCFNTTI